MKQSEFIKMNYVKDGVEYTPQYTVDSYEPIKENDKVVDFELIGFKLIKTAQEVAEQKQIDICEKDRIKTNEELTEEQIKMQKNIADLEIESIINN